MDDPKLEALATWLEGDPKVPRTPDQASALLALALRQQAWDSRHPLPLAGMGPEDRLAKAEELSRDVHEEVERRGADLTSRAAEAVARAGHSLAVKRTAEHRREVARARDALRVARDALAYLRDPILAVAADEAEGEAPPETLALACSALGLCSDDARGYLRGLDLMSDGLALVESYVAKVAAAAEGALPVRGATSMREAAALTLAPACADLRWVTADHLRLLAVWREIEPPPRNVDAWESSRKAWDERLSTARARAGISHRGRKNSTVRH